MLLVPNSLQEDAVGFPRRINCAAPTQPIAPAIPAILPMDTAEVGEFFTRTPQGMLGEYPLTAETNENVDSRSGFDAGKFINKGR